MRRACPHTIFSTLYITLPHDLIKEKLLDLTEWTFERALQTHFIWPVMTEKLFFTSTLVMSECMRRIIHKLLYNIYMRDSEPSYTDNSTFRYLDNLLNIDNPYFEGMVNQFIHLNYS